MKKVIGYERVQKLGAHGEPRIGWKPIYEITPPLERPPITPLEEVPPLDANNHIWNKGKER